MTGFCLKCRATREVTDAHPVALKNGTPTLQGTCPTCGTKVVRIGKVK